MLGNKGFVADLHSQSALLESIDDDFRHCVEWNQLSSFHESKPMSVTVVDGIIVPQDSAMLGYPQEKKNRLASHI